MPANKIDRMEQTVRTADPTVQQLSRQLHELERSCCRQLIDETPVSTGITALDTLLPTHGLRRGTLVEWLSACSGGGAAMLMLTVLSNILQQNDTCVIIDESREFYPPCAAALGINLTNTIVVHPRQPREAIWAFEQSLRCSGVTVSVCWLNRLDNRVARRLQLAAESSGAWGMLLRPASVRHQPVWADIRWLIEPQPFPQNQRLRPPPLKRQAGLAEWIPSRRLRVQLLYCRGGLGGATVELEMDDETGFVHLAPAMAAATPEGRSAGA